MIAEREFQERQLLGYTLSALLLAAVTLLMWWFREGLTLANFSLIYMLVIVVIAVWIGLGPALLAAVLSFLAFNFFLIRPYYTLTVEDPRELIDLLIFGLVAFIASRVASYARRQAAAARMRSAEQQLLYDLSSAFNRLTDAGDVIAELTRVLRQALGVEEVAVLPEANPPETGSAGAQLTGLTSYLLLSAGETVYGTLKVTFTAPPSDAQTRLLMACTVQTAMALQRIELAGRVQQSRTLEEADRLKTALLRAVSHDLRTPITIIKTSAGNLRALDDRLTPIQRLEMAHAIEDEADHLDQLVGDLLDMSRLQAGALALRREWNALIEIAADVAARAWQLYRTERVRLDFPDDMPLVYCDYALLLRTLSNIAENALRYEPLESRVVIRGEVAVSEQGNPEARVAVVNHGASIPDAEKALIMEPFYQGRDSQGPVSTGRSGHVGLGLAVARGVVEAHQGRMWLEDTPGGGATFIIALPLSVKEHSDDADSDR